MGKLFKFLKPRVGAVLAIVAVLIIQAYCDLSLPHSRVKEAFERLKQYVFLD